MFRLWIMLLCLGVAMGVHAAEFKATGNTDPTHQASAHKRGEVVVTFDLLPTKMSFDLPGHIKAITENGIPYINGATETYVDGWEEGMSFESWNDDNNTFSRMWIESQSPARIVVRHRCALVRKGEIAHADKKKVAPYGKGDWVDEWYIIHPDGTYIRRVKVWTAVASKASTIEHKLGSFYELEGMYLWWGRSPEGTKVADHLEDGFITLVEMDGKSKTIKATPYPVGLDGRGMYEAYGTFRSAPIHVINTKSTYRPWRSGREASNGPFDGKSILTTPYKPVHPMSQLVPTFPANSGSRGTYAVAGLGQVNYSDFWRREKDSFSEIWLNGFTRAGDPGAEVSAISRSWQDAPKMSLAKRNGTVLRGYDMAERAYLIETPKAKEVGVKLAASTKSPLMRPMFLVNGWGDGKPTVTLNGEALVEGSDYRFGFYETLELDDRKTWTNVLAVWLNVNGTRSSVLTITGAGKGGAGASPAAAGGTHEYRVWTSTAGSTIDARLKHDGGLMITLEKKDGKTLRVPRTKLSKADQDYLKSVK